MPSTTITDETTEIMETNAVEIPVADPTPNENAKEKIVKFENQYLKQRNALYIGNLEPNVNEDSIKSSFKRFGNISAFELYNDSGKHKNSFGFVTYENPEHAVIAKDSMNYLVFNSRCIRIMWKDNDSARRTACVGNVFIKNLHASIDTKTLYETLIGFGEIYSAKLATDKDGNSLGYGFVQFFDVNNADRAIKTLNNTCIEGEKIHIERYLTKNERANTNYNVYIKNFSHLWNESDLRTHFQQFGKIASAVIMKTPEGKSREFGFVCYADAKSARDAVNYYSENKITLSNGQVTDLYVAKALTKIERIAKIKEDYEIYKDRINSKSNVYFKNIDPNTTEGYIESLFSPFGKITSLAIMTDKFGKSKGFGFVCYKSPSEADAAIETLSVTGNHFSRPFYVAHAMKKSDRMKLLSENQHKKPIEIRHQNPVIMQSVHVQTQENTFNPSWPAPMDQYDIINREVVNQPPTPTHAPPIRHSPQIHAPPIQHSHIRMTPGRMQPHPNVTNRTYAYTVRPNAPVMLYRGRNNMHVSLQNGAMVDHTRRR
ncbi:hypothetical protein A3Q56_03878 [Intoshia linei]|uniref:RRM domain-containing protein n=1 Tax=Intoshia linei TaxID=1819745 RepID=A0A177B459_9BILA|nr:hypothetical protein A3Q56_03878 [Intoshia linei]